MHTSHVQKGWLPAPVAIALTKTYMYVKLKINSSKFIQKKRIIYSKAKFSPFQAPNTSRTSTHSNYGYVILNDGRTTNGQQS
jgi:hypothetical protein